jgi:hypothetical protein
MFTKEPIEFHTNDMTINDLVETRTSCKVSNQELVEKGANDMLERQLVEKIPITLIFMQINDVSINLLIGVSFPKKICPNIRLHRFPSVTTPNFMVTT